MKEFDLEFALEIIELCLVTVDFLLSSAFLVFLPKAKETTEKNTISTITTKTTLTMRMLEIEVTGNAGSIGSVESLTWYWQFRP